MSNLNINSKILVSILLFILTYSYSFSQTNLGGGSYTTQTFPVLILQEETNIHQEPHNYQESLLINLFQQTIGGQN